MSKCGGMRGYIARVWVSAHERAFLGLLGAVIVVSTNRRCVVNSAACDVTINYCLSSGLPTEDAMWNGLHDTVLHIHAHMYV